MKAPEFYIGYIARAPKQIGRYIAKTSTLLCVMAVVIAVLLVLAQAPFAASKFDYGVSKNFTGRLRIAPYPVLLDTSGVHRYLLVAPGKHGATSLLESMDGRQVNIRGSLIERDGDRMVEVLAAEAVGGDESKKPEEGIGAVVSLTGEIVDSKCYLGVMNPGRGKVHKDCAIRCISGRYSSCTPGSRPQREFENSAADKIRWRTASYRGTRLRCRAGTASREAGTVRVWTRFAG